jgi:hypothetical protein
VEVNHLLSVLVELLNQSINFFCELLFLYRLEGAGICIQASLPPLIRACDDTIPFSMPIKVSVVSNRVDPGGKAALVPVVAQGHPGLGKGLLRQVLGIAAAAGQTSQVVKYLFVKEPQQLSGCTFIALLCALAKPFELTRHRHS